MIGGILAVAANLPPEHGHPYTRDHAAIVHRHASLHVVRGTHHASLSDGDGLIVWIDGSYTSGTKVSIPHLDVIVSEQAPSFVRRLMLASQATGIHGPPGQPSGSRAPPLPLSI